MPDRAALPENLPRPADDGAADHLRGRELPSIMLASTDGEQVDVSVLGNARSVLYFFPLAGRPGNGLPEGWDAIPGARGCTTEACSFRDHFEDLQRAGVRRVYGLSSQRSVDQREIVERLHLPFAMLSDPNFLLAEDLDLPTFSAPEHDQLYARLTLIIARGLIDHVFYPVFPPDAHAQTVVDWLRSH